MPNFCVQAMSKAIHKMSVLFFFGGGKRVQNPTFGDTVVVFSVKKKLHKALHLVQFLTSFISFYFEILSYLACGEDIN